jgi:hypothetical protein
LNFLIGLGKNAKEKGKGEQLAIDYEKWRLIQSGKESWIDNIEWVAEFDDGAGFDILSKNPNGILYRLFNFSDAPKLFIVNGSFDQFCKKEAVQYKGVLLNDPNNLYLNEIYCQRKLNRL